MHGENHDFGGQTALSDLARNFQSIEAGHHHVYEKHVRFELLDQPNGVQAIAGFADYFKIFLRIEESAEAFTHDAMIVRQNNFDAHGGAELVCSFASRGNSAV